MNENYNNEEVNNGDKKRKPTEILPGVELCRFKGPDFVKLIAKRPAHDGAETSVYEIEVDRNNKIATATRNNEVLFQMSGDGIGTVMLEKLAVSSLHCYCIERRKANARKLRRRKAKHAEKRNLYFTPQSVIDEIIEDKINEGDKGVESNSALASNDKDTEVKGSESYKVPIGYAVRQENKSQRVQLLVRPSVFDIAKKVADRQGISLNEWVNQVIEKGVAK